MIVAFCGRILVFPVFPGNLRTTSMQAKRDINKVSWENTEFPAVCEPCLGPNVYTRMTREVHGKECKICSRPFGVFRWLPNPGARWKKTDICMTCARLKNCCQSCLLDLQYGLPIQVRDAALKLATQGPSSDINREYYAQNNEGKLKDGQVPEAYNQTDDKARKLLQKLASSDTYYKRSGPDLPLIENGNPVENAKDSSEMTVTASAHMRFRAGEHAPPDDKRITSLFLTGVEDDLPEHAIRNFFSEYGPIKSLVCVHRARSAFVNFGTRAAAENAASSLRGEAVIKGCPLRVQWGRPRPLGAANEESNMPSKRPLNDEREPQAERHSPAKLKRPNAPIETYMPLAPPGSQPANYSTTQATYLK